MAIRLRQVRRQVFIPYVTCPVFVPDFYHYLIKSQVDRNDKWFRPGVQTHSYDL